VQGHRLVVVFVLADDVVVVAAVVVLVCYTLVMYLMMDGVCKRSIFKAKFVNHQFLE
jgi:hypothetical protein